MIPLRPLVAFALLLLARQGPAPAASPYSPPSSLPQAAVARAEGLRFEIATRPFLDLYFQVRALSASKEPVPDFAGYQESVGEARALDTAFGGPLGWGMIEGLLADCATAKEARVALERVKQSVNLPSGKTIELRAAAVRLGAALERAEPAFLEHVWPGHERAIEAARARIASDFAAKQGECLAYVAHSLGLVEEPRAIPVRLVYEMPAPGAVTQRVPGLGAVCFVGVRAFEGALLFESLLHEATHALDLASLARTARTGKGSVLDLLRTRLEEAGFSKTDREWRDVPHTLMFVQAGETVRRLVDPQHVHYGEAAHYYDKLRALADLELAAWKDFLDGKATSTEALERIVAGVIAARKPR